MVWGALMALAAAASLTARLGSPVDLSYPEAAISARALDSARGLSPYHDWRDWPHAFSPYGPFTYHSAALAARLAPGEPSAAGVRMAGRLLSLAGLAAAGVLILLVSNKAGIGFAGGFASLAAWLAWPAPLEFAGSHRPDAPQVALALTALALAIDPNAGMRRWMAAAAALSASFWFKPASFGAAAALLWVAAGRFGAAKAAAGAAIFAAVNLGAAAAMNAVMEGRLFLNMAGSLDNGWEPGRPLGLLASAPAASLLALAAGSACGIPALARGARAVSPGAALGAAALASAAGAFAATFKEGSDVNYYLEPLSLAPPAAMAALAAGFGRLRPALRRGAGAAGLAALIAVTAPAAAHWAKTALRPAFPLREPPIAAKVREIEGEVLPLTDPWLGLVRANVPPAMLDPVQWSLLAEQGRLDPNILLGRIRERRFAAIALLRPEAFGVWPQAAWLPDSLVEAINEAYEIREIEGDWAILRPRN